MTFLEWWLQGSQSSYMIVQGSQKEFFKKQEVEASSFFKSGPAGPLLVLP